LSIHLSSILGGGTPGSYKHELMGVFNREDRYHLLKKNIDFKQYQLLRNISFIKSNRNKNGFIFIEKEKRMAPFGLLANRTIGLSREYLDSTGNLVSKNVGLEKTYDSLLKGVTGKRLVRRIAGGAFVPVEGSEIEPENGKDIITTIDINIQDVAEQALLKMLEANECLNGTCIVMEVKTGKIKAIANLGRQKDGSYKEDYNYAITRSEPGSTFKLVTMLAAMEDQYINLNSPVNLEGGKWDFGGRTVWDSERHNHTNVTYKQAFELSSNVGMAKLAVTHYNNNPKKFIAHLERLNLNRSSGINLLGESTSIIPNPSGRNWSDVALPWMSFGYNISISPLQTLMVYNAVANNGKMLKPYLVNAIMKDGKVVQEFKTTVLRDSICSKSTLLQLQSCLEGVVLSGTGKSMLNRFYTLAGKTGTAQVANGNKGYSDHIYQSSFAGYFPAKNPKYACIVVIKNKPFAEKYYGAQVAGPVFSEIANKLFTVDPDLYASYKHPTYADSSKSEWNGSSNDFKAIAKEIGKPIVDAGKKGEWSRVKNTEKKLAASSWSTQHGSMPELKGFGLKDALELLERQQLQVIATGKGKVTSQSIPAGMAVQKGQTVYLNLGSTIE
jgi:cell division protein FtsI (penicillin-binding protein 3)